MKALPLILWTGLLFCRVVTAAQAQATLFIDSSDPAQAALVSDINNALFYSPTLRQRVAVKVFDINPASQGFSGEVEYQADREGKAIARYRPGRLPYVFCQQAQKTIRQYTLSKKDQLCFYSQEE